MEIGFTLYDTMIYHKNGAPFPESGRYSQVFEYMFVFSKGVPKTFNPINDKENKSFGRETGRKTVRELIFDCLDIYKFYIAYKNVVLQIIEN